MNRLRTTPGWRVARRCWYRTLEVISPDAYLAWNRRFPDRFVVGTTTDVMVEGYPSAANSVARETLALTQPGISVASHLHSATHVRRALALSVPVLVVLRPPVDSIASIMARFPDQGFRPGRELRRYERFYRAITPLADQVALSRFEDTVDHLGTVVRAMNSRLGTRFLPFADGDPAIGDRVREVLDAWSEARFGDRAATSTARPSDARRHALDAARTAVRDRRYAPLLASCERLHAELSDLAGQRLLAWASAQEAGDRP